MSNPVLERKTAALSGRGATVQGIAMITLLDLGFVVAAAMMPGSIRNSLPRTSLC